MKKLVVGLAVLFCLAGMASAQAQVQLGVSGGSNGISNFYLSIGSYFKVPQTQVTVIKQRNISDEQIPVVLFIAQKSHKTPDDVLELKAEGFSWMDVALRCGLGPDVFYVASGNTSGPYANAYGKYKKYSKKKWSKIRLSDDDIVNFVNLRFISDKYRCKTDDVVAMRAKGQSFVNINANWNTRTAPEAVAPPANNGKKGGRGHGNPGRDDQRQGPRHDNQ